MIERRHHPAVMAGLLGSAIWAGAPTVALASPIDDVAEAVTGSLLLQFVIGCAIGAAVAGVISFVADRIASRDEQEAAPKETDDEFWRSSSLSLVQAQEEVSEQDPTGDLGRFRTGQITIDLPQLAAEAAVQAADAAVRGPRHFATTPQRKASAPVSSRRAGRHFASANMAQETARKKPEPASAEAPTTRRGRHFAGAAAPVVADKPVAPTRSRRAHMAGASQSQANLPTPAESLVAAKAEAIPAVAAKPLPASELRGRARLAMLPTIESRHETGTPSAIPSAKESQESFQQTPIPRTLDTLSATKPPEQVQVSKPITYGTNRHAQKPVEKQGITARIRKQMSSRTKGVRSVLAERLGGDGLQGVPIIPRADGSVVDLEPSWFDQTLAPVLAGITGVNERISDTATRQQSTSESASVAAGESSRASYISHHVAEVNVGVFPERRSAEELEHGDVWEQALAAMGESIDQPNAPTFKDVVGGPSTIDDPEGLEGPTGFIPVRSRAVRRDAVDTETYVNYLLRDELSQSDAEVLRQAPQAHLRVIEGGTGKLRVRRLPTEGDAPTRGRHFAAPHYAAEAL